jgi:hypothetical protein
MHQVSLSLSTVEDGSFVERAGATFEESDVKLFRQFMLNTARLQTVSLMKRGLPSMSNISFGDGKGTQFKCESYEDAELYELLHVLRPILLAREPSSFERIAGVLGKQFTSENLRGHLKVLRTVFADGELKLYMQISLNGRELFDDSTLKLWLNGSEYHQDSVKSDQWKTFAKSLTEENTRAFVMTQLHSKIKATLGLAYIVSLILQKIDEPKDA